MTDRPVSLGADGSATLRTGRFYRLLLVVNGAAGEREVYQAIAALGFAPAGDLAVSSAAEWAAARPRSWPEEHPPQMFANEVLVRASGSFLGPTRVVAHDTPIAGGGALSVAEAWDAGEADAATATATGRGDEPAEEPAQKPSSAMPIVALGVLLGGVVMWKLIGGRKVEAQESERIDTVAARAARVKRVARVNELLSTGLARRDAEAVAETETWEKDEREAEDEHRLSAALEARRGAAARHEGA